jgi:hypothetical protein
VRTRSSKEFPLECEGTAAGAEERCAAAAGCAVDSLLGGGPPLVDPAEAEAATGAEAVAGAEADAAAGRAAPFSVSSRATTV